jgi:5'-deoxynucleotidase YfbR-like HD superfamily hydrolase
VSETFPESPPATAPEPGASAAQLAASDRAADDALVAMIRDKFRRERDEARAELAEVREKLATTQAIARMLQATALEILHEAADYLPGPLMAEWRARLVGDHA